MKNGPYILITAPVGYPGKRYRGRYCYEHISVWWTATGMMPLAGYEIHHLNGDHRDNRIVNLQLVTAQEHKRIHGKLKSAPLVEFPCAFCRVITAIKRNSYKRRQKINKLGLFCSASCGTKFMFRGSSKVEFSPVKR